MLGASRSLVSRIAVSIIALDMPLTKGLACVSAFGARQMLLSAMWDSQRGGELARAPMIAASETCSPSAGTVVACDTLEPPPDCLGGAAGRK